MKTKAIGAFCTDIKDSARRIDEYGKLAFLHHSTYLGRAAEAFEKRALEKDERGDAVKSKIPKPIFWIPGDALWGLVLQEKNKSNHQTMVEAFARMLNTCAFGLSAATGEAETAGIELMEVRAAMLGGKVLGKKLESVRSTLYNGDSLNGCGRLQQEAGSNSIIFGVIFPTEEQEKDPLINLDVGVPAITFGELDEYHADTKLAHNDLRKCEPGCRLAIEVVEAPKGQRYIRFFSWPREIKGLKKVRIMATEVKMEIDYHKRGIRLREKMVGPWMRSSVTVNKSTREITLSQLVKLAEYCNLTLPREYQEDFVKILLPQTQGEDFSLYFRGKRGRPRPGKWQDELHYDEHKNCMIIDFKQISSCILPLYRVSDRNTVLLLQKKTVKKKKSLILREITDDRWKKYDDLGTFEDAWGICIKLSLD